MSLSQSVALKSRFQAIMHEFRYAMTTPAQHMDMVQKSAMHPSTVQPIYHSPSTIDGFKKSN